MAAFLDPVWDMYREHRDLDLLKEEILTYPWYEAPQNAGESLLMRAVETSDLGAVLLLLSMGESPLLPANDGFTFLHQAVDQVSSVGLGLKRDSVDLGPIREVALAILTALLHSGADPNVLGADGTALHRAAGSGVVESARILLSYGANIEARMLVDGELTPLMHAALMDEPQMVRFLLDHGADRRAISGESLTHPPMSLKQLLMSYSRNPHTNEILEMLDSV